MGKICSEPCRYTTITVATLIAAINATATASTTKIVQYTFPLSWNGSGTVADLSPFANNGKIQGSASVSATIPPGMPSSSQSIKTNSGGIVTSTATEFQLLSNSTLTNYGGFSYEAWFRWDGTSTNWPTQKIIDYSGTESLQLFNPNGKNQTAGEMVQFAFNSATDAANAISFPISANVWYHAIATFNSGTNKVNASGGLAGLATFSIDSGSGPTIGTLNVTKSNYGDGLVRPIAVGLNGETDGNYVFFNGLIYNPTVSLGVIPQPGPSDPDSVLTGVPEPASVGVVACLAAPLLLARRRSRA